MSKKWREAKKRRVKKVEKPKVVYATFLSRLFAMVMDTFMIVMPITFLIGIFFGYEAIKDPNLNPTAGYIQMGLLLVITVLFWLYSGQTPGKRAFGLHVVDAKSFEKANAFQLTIRYFGYFISTVSLIGFFLPLFRKDRRALHDIISRTAVLYKQ
jgi:uncharacterized RDD family membrane protein YckC